MTRISLSQPHRTNLAIVSLAIACTTLSANVFGQTRRFPLHSTEGLHLINVVAEQATLHGKKGLRVIVPIETLASLSQLPQGQRVTGEGLLLIDGLEFGDGIIEAEIAGAPAPGAPETSRGFVGIAFRVQSDLKTFESFYLRPTNGRAVDQERRNHTVQYAAAPDWPFFRTRKETPSKYEAYVDAQPSVWTKFRIEVRGFARRAVRPRSGAADANRQ